MEKNAAEQFGEMELWMFTLGEYRLFLNPITKRWYFFDRAHNYWKDINAPAGSVVFTLKGSELEMQKTGSPAVSAGRKELHFCPQCGAEITAGKNFCNKCGTKVR